MRKQTITDELRDVYEMHELGLAGISQGAFGLLDKARYDDARVHVIYGGIVHGGRLRNVRRDGLPRRLFNYFHHKTREFVASLLEDIEAERQKAIRESPHDYPGNIPLDV